jgi:hypothetical protein
LLGAINQTEFHGKEIPIGRLEKGMCKRWGRNTPRKGNGTKQVNQFLMGKTHINILSRMIPDEERGGCTPLFLDYATAF